MHLAEFTMLNELVKRLGGTRPDRRAAARVRKRYTMVWDRAGSQVPGVGLEISEKGLLFATQVVPTAPHVDVALDLQGRKVRARVKIARRGTVEREGIRWEFVAAVFQGIAADDWDEIVRFCQNRPPPRNRALEQLAAKHDEDDDAYRLLPLRVQERIVAELVRAGRLNPDSERKNPLLRLSYRGTTPSGAVRLNVTSRRITDDEVLQFESSMTVDDSGTVKLER